jgi:transcriptional regulator with XRE-family HTH domain
VPRPHRASIAVKRALKRLGSGLKEARIRRGLTAAVVAERAFTSRPALQRVEAGDTGVSIGIYAAVIHVVGLLDRLEALADPGLDELGLALSSEALPKRVRTRRTPKP